MEVPRLGTFLFHGLLRHYQDDLHSFVPRHAATLRSLTLFDNAAHLSSGHIPGNDSIISQNTSLALSHLVLLTPLNSIYISQATSTLGSLTIYTRLYFCHLNQLFPPRTNVLRSLTLTPITISPQFFQSLAEHLTQLCDLRVCRIYGMVDDMLQGEEGKDAETKVYDSYSAMDPSVRNLSSIAFHRANDRQR
jgi:hypothetical protein